MLAAVAPLEDISWTVAYKRLLLLFPRSIKPICCVIVVVSNFFLVRLAQVEQLKHAPFFNADLNVIEKTEKCQRFFASLLSEFKSNP